MPINGGVVLLLTPMTLTMCVERAPKLDFFRVYAHFREGGEVSGRRGKTGEVSMSNSLILLITMFFSKLNFKYVCLNGNEQHFII